jgi:arginine N-succinyltransferase
MLVLRSATENDLDAILDLARGIGAGMTTLKPDRAALRERLDVAARSFAGELAPNQADYVFVLEDTARRCICGISAIKAAVGVTEPFYNYHIGTSVHSSPESGLVNRVQALHLTHDLSGASELCSLYLHPDYRTGANGKLLSKARLLFLAQFPELFSRKIFAEMRGFLDQHGASPFWERVGRPFFHMDFHDADDRCGKGDRLFIEQLVPRLPLYTHLLGAEACAAIGMTHVDTIPARRLLEREGLHFDGYIDIFDGGPVLQANLQDLRALRESRLLLAAKGTPNDSTPCLIATTPRHRFRVIVADADPQAGIAPLPPAALEALACEPGATLRVLALQGHDSWNSTAVSPPENGTGRRTTV